MWDGRKRPLTLGLEILKSLQKVNPVFMQDPFYRRKWLLTRTPHMVQVNAPKTAKCSN